MPTGLVIPCRKKASRTVSARATKSRIGAGRRLKVDAEEIALHAAVSTAAARDLRR